MFKQVIRTIVILISIIFFSSSTGLSKTESLNNHTPNVLDIVIRISDIGKDHETLYKIAHDLIYLKKSGPFFPELLQNSIQALKLSKKFSHINVDSKDTIEGTVIIFDLIPFRLIKGIEISGAYPLFEQRILNTITIYIGDSFVSEELEKQAHLIERLYTDEGFLDTRVDVSTRKDPEDDNVILTFQIQKGSYLRLNQLEFKGNENFSSGRLKRKMKTWKRSFLPGNRGRVIEKELIMDIEKLQDFYRNNHYADVTIAHEIHTDLENQIADVLVLIEEGLQYQVEFLGNEHFRDWTLKKDLVIFRDGNQSGLGLIKSVRKMKDRYKESGFLETRIRLEETEVYEKNVTARKIKFFITEGPRSLVETVSISGNNQFQDKLIQKQILTQPPGFIYPGNFLPETLELDTLAIKTLYAQEGYMETTVNSDTSLTEENRVKIFIDIEEGPRTIVSHTEIRGLSVITQEEAHKAMILKPGEPFRKYMVTSDENTLSSLISAYGFPHVKVSAEVSFSQDLTNATVIFNVDEGPFVRMGRIYYSGNFRTQENILAREVDMEPGEAFSLRRMLEGQRAIRDMDIFDSVQFKTIGLKEKAEKVHLFVEMEEKKPYYIQTSLGYQTDLGAYINLKAGDRNFLGKNKDLWLGGFLSEIGHRGEIWYSDPWFFNAKIPNTFGVFTEKKEEFNKNFGVKIHGASLGFSRIWTSKLSTGLAFRYENRKKYDTNGSKLIDRQEEDQDQYRSRNILVIAPSIVYDTRDSSIRPKKGLLSIASADISQGIDNDLDSFVKYNLDGRYFFTPGILPRLTIACLGRMGYIEPTGNVHDIPDDQLFFLGGTADVRGFRENMLLFDTNKDPVGGRFSIVGSLEARIDLGGNFELATFLDAGRIKNTEIPVDKNDIRTSAGLGLRYITPIGPIGLLYGHKLDRKDGESPGRIHFSLGYTF